MVTSDVLAGFRSALAEHGWHGATMLSIAEAAGSSRMTLHRRGVTKDALLGALVEALAAEHREAMWPAMTGSESGAVRLRAAVGAELELTEQNLALLEALDAISHAVLYHEASVCGVRRSYIDPYVRILLDGAADGSLRPVAEPEEVATVLFTMIGPTYRHLRYRHDWSVQQTRAYLVDFASAGVTP